MYNSLKAFKPTQTWTQPQLFVVNSESDMTPVQKLVDTDKVVRFFDSTDLAADELYDIEYPQEKDTPQKQKTAHKDFVARHAWPRGTFVYFPWDRTLVRFPNRDELRALRTSRNRNLITADEQKKLYGAKIFVAGLSVGSNIVEALVAMGIGGKFVVADMDIIEPSNLNRIRAPYHDVGTHKADAIAMRMNQIDPYIQFEMYRDGVDTQNLLEILDKHKPDIIIDEIDQIQLKIKMRREAQKRGIAVLSAADDGDSALLDIERYDLDRNYTPYHGLIPAEVLSYLEIATAIPRQALGVLIGKYFVGTHNIPLRMFQSLAEVSKTLPSWPQLGGAATQAGIAIAYASRRIILGQQLKAGRFIIGPDQVLDADLDDPGHRAELEAFQDQLDSFTLDQIR
jgi:hypothetical protein